MNVKLNKIDCVCTAFLRSDVQKAWQQRLPKGLLKKSLVSQAAPDIIINSVKGV